MHPLYRSGSSSNKEPVKEKENSKLEIGLIECEEFTMNMKINYPIITLN